METWHEKIEGPILIDCEVTCHGMIVRQATVAAGGILHLHGMVTGDLIVEPGAEAHVYGMVNGTVRNLGGLVEIHGMVDSIVSAPEGLTAIAPSARVKDVRR